MTDRVIPEGFRKLNVTDDFVGLIGPLWFKVEGERLRVGLPLEPRHGNPMGWAHGGLLVTVADMVMGAGSGHVTGIRWPHPTISLSTEFVRGARLGQWLEGTARVAPSISASAAATSSAAARSSWWRPESSRCRIPTRSPKRCAPR
jgi:acyl-coenzyme A thioesterase 13